MAIFPFFTPFKSYLMKSPVFIGLILLLVAANALDMSTWHTGAAKAGVKYSTNSKIYDSTTDVQYQNLEISLGGGPTYGWQNVVGFSKGGIDTTTDTVLDWTKTTTVEPTMTTQTSASKIDFKFVGYYVVKGNRSSITYVVGGDGSISPANVVGEITLQNKKVLLGDVVLSSLNGVETAKFDATVSGTLGSSTSTVACSAVHSFTIQKGATTTSIKYGVTLDWAANKNFPTEAGDLVAGDQFSLVTKDRVGVAVYPGASQVTSFTVEDPTKNLTAIFKKNNGVEICKQHFTKEYEVVPDAVKLPTDRFYVSNSGQSVSGYQSTVFVAMDSLVYGTSTGLTFDPSIELPLGGALPSWAIYAIAGGGGAIFIALVVIVVYKKRKSRQTSPV